ncbi:MAG: metallophosphoesterase family protein, partial [Rhabdochlamydiaceae bacterium]
IADTWLKENGSYESFFTQKLKGSPDSKTILIGHASASGAVNASEREMEAGNALEFNPKSFPRFDVVLLGHIHKMQELKTSKNYSIWYPGPPVLVDFSEVREKKGYLRVSVTSGMVQFVPFKTKSVREYSQIVVDLVNTNSLSLLPERLKMYDGKLVKLVVHAKTAADINEKAIADAFEESGADVIKLDYVIQESKRTQSLKSENIVYENLDHQDLLKQWMRRKVKDDEIDKSVAKMAYKIGSEVIAQCLNG